MNIDHDKMLSFTTNLKNALIRELQNEQDKNSRLQSALNMLKEDMQSIPTRAL